MSHFQVVDDSYREPQDSKYSDLYRSLLRGETVFVAGKGSQERMVKSVRLYISRHGRRLATRTRTVDGEVGCVMWAKEAAA